MKRQIIWVSVIAAVFTSGFFMGRIYVPAGPREPSVSYSDVLSKAQDGQVKEVTISGTSLTGTLATGEAFHTTIPSNDPQMFSVFREHGVNIANKDQNQSFWISTLISLVPFVLVAGIFVLGLCLIVFLVVLILRYRAPVSSN
jgi:cell division protease FtsH